MKQLADGVYLLRGFPPHAINVYLVENNDGSNVPGAENVLIDAGSRHAAGRILRELKGRRVDSHALTHAHGDHQGSSHKVCIALGIPLWCGELDAEAAEDGRIRERLPKHPVNELLGRLLPGPPHPVARRLHEGDTVAGFRVLDTPGHSAGHVSFWREADRTLICGDVFTNVDTLTGMPGLHEPKWFFTPDPEENRRSMRKLSDLQPALVCFGHGAPLRDPAKLKAFTDKATAGTASGPG